MMDAYGRRVESIRISVTKRCNLSCFYCHREGQVKEGNIEMKPAELERIGRLLSSLGIAKAKLTGGEPLLRSDIAEVVAALKPSMREVSMTTNGILLSSYARKIKKAGLDRVNISIDTMDRKRYRMITGVNALDRVLAGIKSAVKAGLVPVKGNMVVMKGINDDEIEHMIDLAGRVGIVLQLIELEVDKKKITNAIYRKYHTDLSYIEIELAKRANRIEKRKMHHRMKFFVPNEVEVVRPMHNTEFCAHCNRLRLTSDGLLKPCLFEGKNLIDVLTPMRDGVKDEELRKLFIRAIESRKPYWH